MSSPSELSPESSRSRIRLAVPADVPALAAWLQRCRPVPPIAARARQAGLDGLLARPEQGACVVIERRSQFLACLPVSLVPHLGLGGLAALAVEWWIDPDLSHESGALFTVCSEWAADWCRAHGIRHALVAPSLAADLPAGGFAMDDGGLWHRYLVPTMKSLG